MSGDFKNNVASDLVSDTASKKTANRKDNRQISFRVNNKDYDLLSHNANILNMSVTAYAKHRALKSRKITPKISSDIALNIKTQLLKMGNNINQLTRKVHQGEIEGTQKQIAFIIDLLKTNSNLLAEIKKSLSE